MEGGALEKYNESDWRMWGMIDRDKVPTITPTLVELDQNEYQRNTCTVYASMASYVASTGNHIPEIHRYDIVDQSIDRWLDISIWRWVSMAVKLIYDQFDDVSYVSCKIWSDDFWEAIKRWYHLVAWYSWNKVYNDDRDDDGSVATNDWGKWTYGHCIRFAKQPWTDLIIVDNYKQRETNIYKLPDLAEKIKSWNMFYNCYFYIPKIIIPMSNLPEHGTFFSTPLRLEVLEARKTELSVHIDNGWKPTYSIYIFDNPTDETDIIGKMQTELGFLRNWLI